MSDLDRDALLRPSLDAAQAPRQMPYSPSSYFWVAFLGGMIPIALWFGLNARRVGRWSRDLPIAALALVVAVGLTALLSALPRLEPETFGWMHEPPRNLRLVGRGLALALWGGLRWRHGQVLKAADLSDQPYPKAFLPGLGVVLAGGALAIGIAAAVITASDGQPG